MTVNVLAIARKETIEDNKVRPKFRILKFHLTYKNSLVCTPTDSDMFLEPASVNLGGSAFAENKRTLVIKEVGRTSRMRGLYRKP